MQSNIIQVALLATIYYQIDTLNIYLCPEIKRAGWSELGRIATNCKAENLFLTACTLQESELDGLKRTLGKDRNRVGSNASI